MRKLGGFILFLIIGSTFWMVLTTINVPKPGEVEEISRQAFKLINQERQQKGISQLIWDGHLEDLAAEHSNYIAETGDFTHSDYGYAENIAEGGCSSGRELYELWRDSPLHHSNMVNGTYGYGAVAIGYELTTWHIGNFNITVNIGKFYATFLAK